MSDEAGGIAANGAQRLLKSWLALAAGALGLSALAAVVLVLARTPLLSSPGVAAHFSAALIMHVELATLVWFLAFSVVLVSCLTGAAGALIDWAAFGLATTGIAAVFASPFVAPGPALLSNYFPVSDSPWFIVGLAIFLGGVLIALSRLAIRAGPGSRQQPGSPARLVLWALLPLAVAAASLVASVVTLPAVEPGAAHEIASWAPGHLIQFFFVTAMMLAWIWLASTLGWEVLEWRGIVWPFVLIAVPTLLALPIHLIYPVAAPEFRKSFTVLMAAGTWIGPLLLLWRWRRGLLRPVRTAGAVAAAMRGSAFLFLVGCALGAAIRADNTMVPAHYHGTVGAATLAFIGVATMLLKLDGRGRRASLQVWMYGIGFTLMALSLAWSGWLGAPRKSAYTEAAAETIGYTAAMAVHGVGGLLAVVATALFALAVLSAMRRSGEMPRLVLAIPPPPRRQDVRRRALAIALAAALVLGSAIAVVTQRTALKAGLDGLLARVPAIDRLSHIAERQRAEVTARFAQGVTMLQARQFDFAMTAFHRVLQIDPKMPEAHVNMGFALIGLEEFAAARDFFNSALAIRPKQLNAYFGLGVAYEGLGDMELALGAMRTYAHLAPSDDPFRIKAESAIWEWQEKIAASRKDKGSAAERANDAADAKKGAG